MRSPERAARLARALWILWAVIVWNVVFDHVIVVAARAYLYAAIVAAGGPGPYARMDDWMHPAATRAWWLATASATAILFVGLVSVRFALSRGGRQHAGPAAASALRAPASQAEAERRRDAGRSLEIAR
jgi:hypothetical protein